LEFTPSILRIPRQQVKFLQRLDIQSFWIVSHALNDDVCRRRCEVRNDPMN